jgi:eukaryotic-like serine/threonine-protein kinase
MPPAPPGDDGTPAPTLAQFLRAVEDSRLLDPDQRAGLRELLPGWREPHDLAVALVERAWLTAWQVNRVYRGQGATLTVGPYLLRRRLGRGDTGDVFQARHRATGRPVALKVVGADRLAGGPRRFLRAAEAAARLDHPHIARAYDAGVEGGSCYLAREYVRGEDLRRLVERDGPLGPDRARDWVRQAALGLEHALGRGIVHRDLRPSHLMLCGGAVKLLDLGLARLDVPEGADGEPLTAAAQVLGSADYVAPEQVLDARCADARADLYALGGTLYFLLCGRPPFPGGSAVSKLLRHLREEPAPLGPGVPAALAAVVRRLLAKRPEDRFQTPAEVADALARLPGGAPGGPGA